ncbi:MAG: hypothetical protein GY845_03120 [Planctomycetes bacterium]|nr:hypothetical protein [Planctomycetota bacterium]
MEIKNYPISKYYYTQIQLPVGAITIQTKDYSRYYIRDHLFFIPSHRYWIDETSECNFTSSMNFTLAEKKFILIRGSINTILEMFIA